jgi:hypothetical protein
MPNDAESLSQAAFSINRLLAEGKKDRRFVVPTDERRHLLMRLVKLLEPHVERLDGTDLSRLAWLYLNLGNESRAAALVSRGLVHEPDNVHCQSLARRGIGSAVP